MSSLPKDFDYSKISDRNYKGDDFNIRADLLSNDPFNRRKCTDVLMGIIFAAFLGGMAYAIGFGYSNGSPGQLLAPISAQPANVICGYSSGYEEFPYLYIYDLNAALDLPINVFGYTTCVKECPSASSDLAGQCADQFECETSAAQTYRYDTTPVMHYCVPIASSINPDVIPNAGNLADAATQILS
jgi:hypothetical protein